MSSERQDHTEVSPWWGEHIHRYNVALKYIPHNDAVLDIACGNGFGSYLLSEKTSEEVVGGDISEKSINYCRLAFSDKANLRFEIIDGTKIPYGDDYYGAIVSFETIEHTTQYKEMLKEFRRVVKNGGHIIISTPNIKVNSPTGRVLNPFHTQEFTFEELEEILQEVFSDVKIFGQEYTRYKKHSLKNFVGKVIEKTLYLRGIRKMPLSIQNKIMQLAIGKDMYPSPEDFDVTDNSQEILKCKTFFAVCRK